MYVKAPRTFFSHVVVPDSDIMLEEIVLNRKKYHISLDKTLVNSVTALSNHVYRFLHYLDVKSRS